MVEREYRVINALQSTPVPVPQTHLLHEQDDIVGTPFYVMDFVQGTIFKDAQLPGLESEERRTVYSYMAQTLAALHNVDVAAAGLSDFSKNPQGCMQRQFKQWNSQYQKNRDAMPSASMDFLSTWLQDKMPADHEITIIHGDYRLDNIIFDNATREPKAVLDWELARLGDPLCDLAHNCIMFYYQGTMPSLRGICKYGDAQAGLPSEHEYIGEYCRARGIDNFLDTEDGRTLWNTYMIFTCFRIAGILHGVYVRSLKGQSAAANARQIGSLAEEVAKVGARLAGFSEPEFTSLALDASEDERKKHVAALKDALNAFMESHVYPAETIIQQHLSSDKRWTIHPLTIDLQEKAKAEGLWNLFMPIEADHGQYGAGLRNLEYTDLCEIMGRSLIAPELFNCGAPDTGNMEVLVRYGTEEQKNNYLLPLLSGKVKSCFAMTEPAVASSDATNIATTIIRDGDEYAINGHKWWTSGAMDPRCEFGTAPHSDTQQCHSTLTYIHSPLWHLGEWTTWIKYIITHCISCLSAVDTIALLYYPMYFFFSNCDGKD
eukprot:m.280272 g.280272  ORF g.280272 m.280272 type:complete len:546 (-) comp15748_c1_seq20:4002-5639(-)